MFKVNIKNSRTTSLTSSVSTVDFEQVIGSCEINVLNLLKVDSKDNIYQFLKNSDQNLYKNALIISFV